jgi:hypothetical protein
VSAGDAPEGAGRSEPSPEALEREIKQTREELGDTVAALVAKADVKTRVKEKAGQLTAQLKARAEETGQQVSSQVQSARHAALPGQQVTDRMTPAVRQQPVPLALACGAMVAGIVLIVWGSRR